MARILLVEDAPVREMLARQLSALGHCCDGAEVGADALERLRDSDYDALVVNGGVVGESAPARIWDGPRLVQAARGITRGRVPVIVSGSSSYLPEQIQDISLMGMVDLVLPLPWVGDELEWTLAEAVNLRREWLTRRMVSRAEPPSLVGIRAARSEAEGSTPGRTREARERELRETLRAAKHRPPKEVAWCASPREGLARAADHLRAHPSPSALRDRLAPALGAPELGPVDGPRSSADGRPLHRWILDDLAEGIHELSPAEHDAPLLALLLAIPESPGSAPAPGPPEAPAVGELLGALRRSVGCLWSLDDGFLVATDPCIAIHRDPEGRLHSPTGPAIEYGDGSGIHALRGYRMPARLVRQPRRTRIADLRASQDPGRLGAVREQFGGAGLVRALAARLVDADTVPVLRDQPTGAFITRALIEDETGARALVASDGSSSRVHCMPVPRSCRTCVEAAAALAGRVNIQLLVEA